jgi:steroid delta-isomerase-like uncharacterized protein
MIMTTKKLRWGLFGILVISVCLLGSAIQAGAQTPIMNDIWAAWNSHDTEKLVSLFTDDCVYEELGIGVIKHGKEEFRPFIKGFFANFPDTHFEMKSSFVSGNWYSGEWVWTGTHSSDLPGLPATGRRFSVRGVSVGELKEGKVKRHSDYYNKMDFLQQIGIKLVPASPPK